MIKAVQKKNENRKSGGKIKFEKYRMKSTMGIKGVPSEGAPSLRIISEGETVHVIGIENDWLHLADDTYVYYWKGRFAEKVDR